MRPGTTFDTNMANLNKRAKRAKSLPLKRGCRIILCKGKGRKRHYNGQEVSVVEYPPKGSWMTVTQGRGVLKWRKSHHHRLPTVDSRCTVDRMEDLFLRCNDDVLTIVFSYLVGPYGDAFRDDQDHKKRRDLLWVKHARKSYTTLSSVCRRWGELCNNKMLAIFGPIDVNLDALPVSYVIPHISWVIKRKAPIGALSFNAQHCDFPILLNLLNSCDTSRLTFVRARVNFYLNGAPITRFNSQWVSQAYTRIKDRGVVDLNNPDTYWVTLQEKFKALGVPYPYSLPKLKHLHDTIAINGRNITELQVNLDVLHERFATEPWDFVSKSLFSLHSVKKLSVSLHLTPGVSSVINFGLEHLHNLQDLSISSSRCWDSHQNDRAIKLISKKLKTLDVSGLAKENYVVGQLSCLKTLTYNCFFSGLVPELNDQEEEDDRVPACFVAAERRIFNLNLHPDCRVMVCEGARPYSPTVMPFARRQYRNALIC